MLSVYYDFQILLAQKYGGISRYIYELASRLPELGADVTVSCLHNHNYYFKDRLGLADKKGLLELGAFWYINKFKAKCEVRRGKYDIVHPTYYHVSYRGRSKLVVTVHDMTHEKYAGIYPRLSKRLIAAKSRIVHEADRIICVSDNTKRDLLEYHPDLDPAQISVIYHDASMAYSGGEFSRMAGRPYVLYVGDRRMYKNFARFTEAMCAVLAERPELEVFCAGGGVFSQEELSAFGEYSSRVHQGGLSDEELARAYAGALCFVFPSEYEGFGIPILEAFACGCPVVCSKASCFPEVAGEAAEYFDPLDADDMAAKILRVIDDEVVRHSLRDKGRERLSMFSWDRAARETLECYKEAIDND